MAADSDAGAGEFRAHYIVGRQVRDINTGSRQLARGGGGVGVGQIILLRQIKGFLRPLDEQLAIRRLRRGNRQRRQPNGGGQHDPDA